MVAYNDRDDLRNVINREQSQKSMLTEYFRMNSVDPFANRFLYREFLEYYRWDKMASKKAKNVDWQDGVCVPYRRRKVLPPSPSEPC
jgi:adenine specific DNA methylase Mod